ncbi:MAG: hypothetical protein ACJ75Z_08605, partial [Solirubrobacterales bacterium]
PLGAVVAVGSLPTSGRRATTSRRALLVAVIAAPIAALLFLALIDLASGGNAHLTRSLLDAGGPAELADAAERRLRLSAHDFCQAAKDPLFWIVIAGVSGAVTRWRRIDALLRPAPLARAGVIGACAAVAAGTLVNDSGATFLVLGWVAVAAALTFSWSQMPRNTAGRSGK